MTGPDGPRPSGSPAIGDFGSFGVSARAGTASARSPSVPRPIWRLSSNALLRNLLLRTRRRARSIPARTAPVPQDGGTKSRGGAPTRTSVRLITVFDPLAARRGDLALEPHDEAVEVGRDPVGRRRRVQGGGVVVEPPDRAHVPREHLVALAVVDGDGAARGLRLLVEPGRERDPGRELLLGLRELDGRRGLTPRGEAPGLLRVPVDDEGRSVAEALAPQGAADGDLVRVRLEAVRLEGDARAVAVGGGANGTGNRVGRAAGEGEREGEAAGAATRRLISAATSATEPRRERRGRGSAGES